LNTLKILKDINSSGKPYIIYKTLKGFDLFTNFSKKIILSNENVADFVNSIPLNKKKLKKTDLYIGFFGYEILSIKLSCMQTSVSFSRLGAWLAVEIRSDSLGRTQPPF
jgi:hypothetical protein